MLLLWIVLITSSTVFCHEVYEQIDDIPQEKPITTTLYPIPSKKATKANKPEEDTAKLNSNTVWKINAAVDLSEKEKDTKSSVSQEKPVVEKQEEDDIKDFKPSPHLGDFIEESVPTRPNFELFTPAINRPTVNSHKYNYKPPKKIPYKIENSIVHRDKENWRPTGDLDSRHGDQEARPTDESPNLPAGGLYQIPDLIQENPGYEDGQFGLEFHGDKTVKKIRANPWKHLLQLMTAFIPVGLIISALTPSVITIEPNNNDNHLGNRYYRRSDPPRSSLPPVSERCRRRLLCELLQDRRYTHPHSPVGDRSQQCRRYRCEDPEAVEKLLTWLFTHKLTVKQIKEEFT